MAKRVTTQELAREIEIIKDNHLAHIAEDIDDLKDAVKENRQFFQDRLDRMDSRIWWIMGITLTSLISIVISHYIGL